MESTLHYLTRLRANGVRLALEAGDLKIHAPKGALDAATLAELKARKAQIVAFLASQQLSGPVPMPRTLGGDPLSPFQHSLWSSWRLDPGGFAYNIPLAFALDGSIDTARLMRSLERLYERHEALRCRFVEVDGAPRQLASERPLDVHVVATTPAGAQQELAAAGEHSFDLVNGPLFHARIFELGPDERILLLNMHHIVADGWSMRVFMQELGTLYTHAADPTCLPPLHAQYIDYCHWRKQQTGTPRYTAAQGYWRRILADAPALLELPLDRPRPALPSLRGDAVKTVFDAPLSAALHTLAQQRGCSLHTLLLAAYQLLLSRYSGQDDVIVGTPHANRGVAEIAHTVGYFVNPLAIRTRIDRNAGFADLLASVRANVLGAIEHGEIPFAELVSDLQSDRSARITPIFQALYSFQPDEGAPGLFAGVRCRPLSLRNASAKFDLSLVVSGGTQLAATFEYSTDLFEPATIEQMAANFVVLLRGVVAAPERAVGTLPVVDARERQRLLHEFNPAPAAYPREASIAAAFAEQAAKHAQRAAVICGDIVLSYRDLDVRAERVARRLREAGVVPGQFVGLAIERSHTMLVAMLAIAKVGAAYVPLDVSLQRDRLAWMRANTNLRCCLVVGAPAPVLADLALLCLDVTAEEAAVDDTAPPVAAMIDAMAPAYVNFSSGSTGQPKSIVCTQRGVVRLVKSQNFLEFSAGLRFVHAAPVTFDAATLEIWGPLLNGGTCVVYPQEMLGCTGIARCISGHGANTMWITSALFNALVDTDPTCFQGLTHLLVGGDVVSPHHVRKTYQANADVVIINGYGPTENTTFTTCHRISRELSAIGHSVPIGRAIAHTRVYVLDAQNNLLPRGAIGELCAAGDGLALGYLGDAPLTAAAFVSDPFIDGDASQNPPARMYRTGDLVRYLPDGALEFIGRKDSQVKVNGYRIELAEVEAAVRAADAVIDCAVLVESTPDAGKRLVAFVVVAADFAPGALQTHLRERLPRYMVPSLICAVDTIPITHNGKLDRERLLAVDRVRLAVGGEYVAPSTPVEQILAQLWSSLLGHERIGVHDDFFALGGHSIVAAQLAAKISRDLRVEVNLRDVFQHASIARLAAHIEAAVPVLTPVQDASADAAQTGDPHGWVPLSPGQLRLWQEYESYPEVGQRNNIAVALKLHGAVAADALERALNTVTARHQPLRARMVVNDGRAGQQFDCDLPVVLQRRRVQGVEAALPLDALVQREYEQPFDLETGPLLRAVLLEFASVEQLLIVVVNHLAFDGWSMGVLVHELAVAYSAEVSGRAVALPELPLSYTQYVRDKHRHLVSTRHARAVAFWQNALRALPERLALPGDKPRPAVFTGHGDATGLRLPRTLRDNLVAYCREHGLTPYMVLLAAYLWVLSEQAQLRDLFVRSSVADRGLPGSETLIGYFMSLIVVREGVSADDTFDTFLVRIKARVLDALAHDVPPEVLSQLAGGRPDAGYYSKFQLIHIHHSFPKAAEVDFAGLVAEQLKPALKIKARFDLCLHTSVGPEYIDVGFVYYADLFSPAALARLASRYGEFLALRFDPVRTGLNDAPAPCAERSFEGITQ